MSRAHPVAPPDVSPSTGQSLFRGRGAVIIGAGPNIGLGIARALAREGCQGAYRISPGSDEPELLLEDFDRPNGLAFSPHQQRLYIADSSARRHLRVFALDAAGRSHGGMCS